VQTLNTTATERKPKRILIGIYLTKVAKIVERSYH